MKGIHLTYAIRASANFILIKSQHRTFCCTLTHTYKCIYGNVISF